jgi:hypothetical protein
MRRAAAVLTALLVTLLAGCDSGTPEPGASKAPLVFYQVTYVVSTDTTGSTIDANYTDGSAQQQKESTPAPVWTKDLTITSTVGSINLVATLSGGFGTASGVSCEIQVNGQSVTRSHNTGACNSSFTLRSYSPNPSPSPSLYSLPPAAPTVPRTRDAECRYATDAEVSTVVSTHMGGNQNVLFTDVIAGGCAYHFTNDISLNNVIITYWPGTVLPKGGVSVSGLGGKATWDEYTLNVQRSHGVVTINTNLPQDDKSINKDIAIALYKLIRNRFH